MSCKGKVPVTPWVRRNGDISEHCFLAAKGPQISFNIMRIKTVLVAYLQEARHRRKALFPAITQLPGKLCTEVSLSIS